MKSKTFTYSVWNTVWEVKDVKDYTLPRTYIKNRQILVFYETPVYKITYGKISRIGIDCAVNEIVNYYTTLHEEPQLTWDPICGKANYVLYDSPVMVLNDSDIADLKCTLEEFVRDVNNHFSFKNYIKKHWVDPLIKKIFRR